MNAPHRPPAAVASFPEMAPRQLLILGPALATVGGLAAYLPLAGYDLPAPGTFPLQEQAGTLRIVLLVLAYGLVSTAAYLRTRASWPVAVALLAGAAVGWSGWEWSSLSFGWGLFAAVVLLIERQSRRLTALAVAVVLAWAFFDDTASWAALLLITRSLGRRAGRGERLLCLGGGLLGLVVLQVRSVDLPRMYLSSERQWVWADGQAANKLGDPMGAALFIFLLLLLLLWLVRPVKPSTADLPSLAIFIFLAWHARRNGIWLGLAAVPTVAACLAGDWSRWRTVTLSAAQGLVLLALLLAYREGPALVGGVPLSAALTTALPPQGLVVYRPSFEPALRRIRPAEQLALATPNLVIDEDGQPARYTAWTRIETNCAPVAELERLQASAVVLDPAVDREVLDAIGANPGWRIGAVDATAALLLRMQP